MEYDYQTYEFDFDKKFISKSSFISLLEYLKEASKKQIQKRLIFSWQRRGSRQISITLSTL